MRRLPIFALLLGLAVSGVLVAQEENGELLSAYKRNFVRANLITKIQVLQNAANEEDVDMGSLYLQSLDFVVENVTYFRNDPAARELTTLTVRLVGLSGRRDAIDKLWELFLLDSSTSVRVEILSAIADLEPPDKEIVRNINQWVIERNSAFADGENVDTAVLSEAAVALGKLGLPSSFPVLFSMGTTGYSESVTRKAREALYSIDGNFSELITRVIRQNSVDEKLEALRITLANDNLRGQEKAHIASVALDQALSMNLSSTEAKEYQRQIRYEAVRVLTDYKWSQSTESVIQHFDATLREYELGTSRLSHLIEAIECLGAMGTHEAAVRLTLYLDVLNSDVENGKSLDEQIVIAVIHNLGKLGDKVAFESLLYSQYLNYSGSVKKAAREAQRTLSPNF